MEWGWIIAGVVLVGGLVLVRARPARRKPRGWRPEGGRFLMVTPGERIGLSGEALVYPLDGERPSVGELSRLEAVTLRTTDQGPFEEDVFLLLDFDERIWIIPSAHPNFMDVYDGLGKRLPLDHPRFIEGMGCAENNSFLLWGRPGPDGPPAETAG